MDFHDKAFFDRLMALTEENNKILHSMRRNARFAQLWRLFYWVVIIGISIGAFYFLQPYVDQLMTMYAGIQSDINSIRSVAAPLNR